MNTRPFYDLMHIAQYTAQGLEAIAAEAPDGRRKKLEDYARRIRQSNASLRAWLDERA